jgi:F-type H+-transporting ATPase subunit b
MVLAAEGSLLDFNPWTLLWAWATFLVTLWALKKVAWPMLAAKMEERENRIREGLQKAEEAEKRAQELLAMQESVLAEARTEAQKLLAEGRAAAEHLRNETLQKAQEQIGQERDRARKEIDLERVKAVAELRKATVDLTLEAASRVLERELKGDDHRRLAAQVIGEVERLRR